MKDSMKAQVIEAWGGSEGFRLREVERPRPGDEEVLVKIIAASVNPVDTKIRQNGSAFAPKLPAILGCDFAGEVTEVGARVRDFQVGDRVYGCAGGVLGVSGGSYAEFIAADAALLAPAPTALSLRESAALPLVSITAWEALQRAGVGAGTSVLILGGTGGVGHVAVQLARAWGAVVTTTASTAEKKQTAIQLGAHEVISYREENLAEATHRVTDGRGFDVVLDATGGSDLVSAFAAAKRNGHVVTIVSRYSADLSLMHAKGLSLHVVFMLLPIIHHEGRAQHGEILRQIAALADAGVMRPLIDPTVFKLADVAAAHDHLSAGKAVGKILIDIDA